MPKKQVNVIDNAAVLATIKPVKGWAEYFSSAKKIWHKAYGTYPTAEMFTAAVWLAAKHQRPGIECLHIAMCLRPEGCSVDQYTSSGTSSGITGKSVGPANNKRGTIVKAGLCTVDVQGKPWAFTLTFTQKGVNFINAQVSKADTVAAAGAIEAKPTKAAKVKAKGKRLGRKANVTPQPVEPISEAPSVTEGHHNDNGVFTSELDEAAKAEHEATTPVDAEAIEALAAHFNS